MKAKVSVRVKPAILDPQGKAVLNSLKQLGFLEVQNVRVGKLIEMDIEGKDRSTVESRVEEMSRKLLANLLVEDYQVELDNGQLK